MYRQVGWFDSDSKDSDLDRIRLILHLNSVFFQKHWECIIFSDFINSKNTVDEIYFYLSCREWLNNGLALKNERNSFEMVQRLEVGKVVPVIKKILNKFNDRDVDMIIQKLKYSSIGKSNCKEYLDMGFVLKILLELYRADKKMKYLFLKKDLSMEEHLASMIPKRSVSVQEQKTHEYLTSYENFRRFIDKHFTFISETEKLQLFCDSYNIGGGEVSFDDFFTCLHEFGVFIKDMKIRHLNFESQRKESPQKDDDVEQDNNLQFLRLLKENRSAEYDIHDLLVKSIEGLGIEKLAFDIKSSEGWLDGTRYGYGWKDVFLIFTRVMNLRSLVNAANLLSMRREPDSQYLINLMKDQSRNYMAIMQATCDAKEFEDLNEDMRTWAVRRLANFLKRRLDKANWYRLMHLILNLRETDQHSEKPLSKKQRMFSLNLAN